MRQLRIFRIFTAILFFAASAAYLFIGPGVHPMAVISEKTQILLSAISITIGATLVWLLLSFLFGRVYCSTVCPIGSISDFFAKAGSRLPRRKRHAWGWKPRKPWASHVLLIYILCLLLGLMIVPFVIEPWNIMRNIAATVRPDAVESSWINLGLGAGTGAAAGIFSFLLIAVWSAFAGRDFCNTVCPIGAALGALDNNTLFHIEIDPDRCTSCGRCEEVCPAHCVKVVSRVVDNSRCVRCFDCLAACDDDAIRFQINNNIRMTPLLRRRSRGTS